MKVESKCRFSAFNSSKNTTLAAEKDFFYTASQCRGINKLLLYFSYTLENSLCEVTALSVKPALPKRKFPLSGTLDWPRLGPLL